MSLPLGTYPLPTFAHHAMDLAGKIAIVTGASRSNGIGARIAHCLAEKGADVALVYTSEASTSEANIVKQHILGLGRRAILIKTDLAQQNCGEIVLRETLEGFGGKNVDILVNNAAIIRGESLGEFGVKKIDSLGNDTGTPARHSTLGFDPDDFNQVMNVNVRAAALLVKALVPHMNRGGRIINVSSILARNPFPGVDIYTASKGALEALTRQWARTLGRSHGITTNAVSPGMILTDMTEGTDPSVLDLSKRSATAGERLGTPDDVAQVVAFLAGDGSRWINGDCIQVHGGVIFR